MEMNLAADELREKCVLHAGIGGKYSPPTSRGRDVPFSLPIIVLYAPKSKWNEFLDLKYTCVANAGGVADCKPVPRSTQRTKGGAYGAWRYMGTIGQQGWTTAPGSSAKGCSGNCNDPTDCDIDRDCLCAASTPGKSSPHSQPMIIFGGPEWS